MRPNFEFQILVVRLLIEILRGVCIPSLPFPETIMQEGEAFIHVTNGARKKYDRKDL